MAESEQLDMDGSGKMEEGGEVEESGAGAGGRARAREGRHRRDDDYDGPRRCVAVSGAMVFMYEWNVAAMIQHLVPSAEVVSARVLRPSQPRGVEDIPREERPTPHRCIVELKTEEMRIEVERIISTYPVNQVRDVYGDVVPFPFRVFSCNFPNIRWRERSQEDKGTPCDTLYLRVSNPVRPMDAKGISLRLEEFGRVRNLRILRASSGVAILVEFFKAEFATQALETIDGKPLFLVTEPWHEHANVLYAAYSERGSGVRVMQNSSIAYGAFQRRTRPAIQHQVVHAPVPGIPGTGSGGPRGAGGLVIAMKMPLLKESNRAPVDMVFNLFSQYGRIRRIAVLTSCTEAVVEFEDKESVESVVRPGALGSVTVISHAANIQNPAGQEGHMWRDYEKTPLHQFRTPNVMPPLASRVLRYMNGAGAVTVDTFRYTCRGEGLKEPFYGRGNSGTRGFVECESTEHALQVAMACNHLLVQREPKRTLRLEFAHGVSE